MQRVVAGPLTATNRDGKRENAMTPSEPAVDYSEVPQKPIAPTWLVSAVLLSALGLGIFAARSVRTHGITSVRGSLEAEEIRLSNPEACEVVECRVAVGQQIAPGDVVAIVRNVSQQRLSELRDALQSVNRSTEAALARFDFESGELTRELDGEIHDLEMQLATIEADQYAAEMERIAWRDALESNGVKTAGHNASVLDQYRVVRVFAEQNSRFVDLDERGRFQAVIAHERAAATADSCQLRVDLCEKRLIQLQKERDRIAQQFKKTLGLDSLALQKSRIETQIQGYESPIELVSPAHGIAMAVAEVGLVVDASEPVVKLADQARRHVATGIPSSLAASMTTGDAVQITFPDGSVGDGEATFIAPSSNAEDIVKVVIAPVGKRWPDVPIGCSVTVAFR